MSSAFRGCPDASTHTDEGLGFDAWNMWATVGAYLLGLGMLVFLWNIYRSAKTRHLQPPVGPDPWDARSLEWMIPSPPPEHNFDELPEVTRLDEFWHRKYDLDENSRVIAKATADEVAEKGDATGVHMPSPSYWPIVLSTGFPLIGYGLHFQLVASGIGTA